MEDKQVEHLLMEVNAISTKYDFMYKKTGEYFNVFDIVGIKSDEVRICRLIKEFIDPKGCHCQGTIYLRLFMEHVLHISEGISEEDYQQAYVAKEYIIDADRRIDLVIKIGSKFIPIEVKIRAEEQKNQCKDYVEKAVGSNLYYLTLDGHAPSLYSTGEERLNEKISLISFSVEILEWLDECFKITATRRLTPISEILRQLIDVIRRLTNRMGEDKEKEIVAVISESRKNIESAIMIEQSLEQAKIGMIKKVMGEIDHRILDKLGWKERSRDYEYDYEKVANSFYANNKSTYPGLNYCLQENVKKDVDVCFRVEIEHNIFCGYCTPEKKEDAGNKLSVSEAEEILNYKCAFPSIEDSWWLYWEYLPNEEDTANFKNANNAWYDLFDDNKFEQFIDKCMETIEKVLAMWKQTNSMDIKK
ncbi:MAG: PD-(D/E)XK nuclease family protein [Acidaminococcaceae bacterium]